MSLTKHQQKLYKKEKEMKKNAPKGMSDEGKTKSAKDAAAFSCIICKQTFPVTTKAAALLAHVDSKHSKNKPEDCFGDQIEAKKKAEADAAAGKEAGKGKAKAPKKSKSSSKSDELPPDLLAAMANASVKKKKKKKKPAVGGIKTAQAAAAKKINSS